MNSNTALVLINLGVLGLTGLVFFLTHSWWSLIILIFLYNQNKEQIKFSFYTTKTKNNDIVAGEKTLAKKKPIEYEIDENGCFNCISHHLDRYGYARIGVRNKDGKLTKGFVHRFIYEQLFGEIPKNYVLMHKCDNRKCMNPEHLTIGTNKENMQDKIEKGRQYHRKGEKYKKLSDDDVREIRSGKYNVEEMAKKFKVSVETIKNAKNYHTYKNVS